ncbi:MAG: tetratricopeptide repeat protein [Sphingomonadaceae bacterium]
MRFTLPALALAAVLATVSSVSHSERPDHQINARSVAMTQQAQGEIAAGRFEAATDLLESALALDPKNRPAFLALADVAKRQGLPGKAIRLYREALMIEPNDVAALAGQGEAMVAKGAVTKARENLARVKVLCAANCAEQTRLSAAIDRGAVSATMSVQAVTPQPMGSQGAPN